jgi:hypothetical protein
VRVEDSIIWSERETEARFALFYKMSESQPVAIQRAQMEPRLLASLRGANSMQYNSYETPSSGSHVDRWRPQYSFLAMVEVPGTLGAMCVQGSITQLNRNGCYVNAADTVPIGTSLQVFISRGEETFVTAGKVTHTRDGIGMGIVFDSSAEDQLQMLDGCLMGFARTEIL